MNMKFSSAFALRLNRPAALPRAAAVGDHAQRSRELDAVRGIAAMMVVMFLGMGVSSIACGLVSTGDTTALMLALAALGGFGAFYHAVGIGWVIRTAKVATTATQ